MAAHGEIRWPPVGKSNGRLWGDRMAAVSGPFPIVTACTPHLSGWLLPIGRVC